MWQCTGSEKKFKSDKNKHCGEINNIIRATNQYLQITQTWIAGILFHLQSSDEQSV